MSDTTTSTDAPVEEPVEVTEESQDNEGTEVDETTEPDAENDDDGLSVDDARVVAKQARKEAAKYRTRLRDLEKQLENVESLEQVQALMSQVREEQAQAERALMVENVALKYGLPEDLATALQGATRDDLEAHAKKLAKYVAPDPGPASLQGGLDPSNGANEQPDPVAASRKARRRGF